MKIKPKVARWAVPLIKARRYKGAKGGRSGGKSHQFCEMAAAKMAADPDFKVAGIREIQKSIKYSLKSLLEQKLRDLGVEHLFDFQDQVIKRRDGEGVAVFLGMQDHTADSVKGLEDFDLALVDEANALSATSLKKLTPTFRKQGSEIWMAWNPEDEGHPVDQFFAANDGDPSFICVHVNITDNPFASETAKDEYCREKRKADAARARIAEKQRDGFDGDDADLAIVDDFEHVWRGGYNKRSQRLVFHNWKEGVLTPPDNVVWFYGVDWGFASDPLAGTKCCILPPTAPSEPHTLYFRQAISQAGVRNEDVPGFLKKLSGIEDWPSRADSARPEMIDYCRRNGLPKMRPAKKGPGSVEDGTSFLQSFNIVCHPEDAKPVIAELKAHSYKVVKHTGEILPVVEDANNHCLDGTRYALEGQHRKGKMLTIAASQPATRPKGADYGAWDDEDEAENWKTA